MIEELDIPVFHDDQHGTAIVVTAALINSMKLVNKKPEELKVIVSGTGAAGSSIIRMLLKLGIKEIYGFNINGTIIKEDASKYDFLTKELSEIVNPYSKRTTLAEEIVGSDVFIGVSAPKILTKEMVLSMNKNAIVFAMANPEPEITYKDAIDGGAYIVGTGRSDFPNQINNVLAFPGLFKGALECRAKKITEEMKMAAAIGIASLVTDGFNVVKTAKDAVNIEVETQVLEFSANRLQARKAGIPTALASGVWALAEVHATAAGAATAIIATVDGLSYFNSENASGGTPKTEIIINVSASDDNRFLAVTRGTYYVSDSDKGLYLAARTSSLQTKEFSVRGN